MPDILTTHVGSLPRGDELLPLVLARDHGEPYDAAAFDRIVQAAVVDAVARQERCGVSIVGDGELGKVGYSTYVTDRLSGFGGNVARKPALDLAALPELRKKLAAIMGEQEFVRSNCVGPVKLLNLQPCLEDIRRSAPTSRVRGSSTLSPNTVRCHVSPCPPWPAYSILTSVRLVPARRTRVLRVSGDWTRLPLAL